MAKILRKTAVRFGGSGPTSSFGQFGSKTAGSPQTSQDPTIIQQLSAWVQGWQDAVVNSNKAAYLEDMNGVCYVFSYMLSYLFQQGIPEWDSGTTYYTNSVVQANNGQWFNSLQDTNLNNPPPVSASNALWSWTNAPFVPPPPSLPIGSLIDHAGGVTPAGFLVCDGISVPRLGIYNNLFLQIGVTWGIGDGVTTFGIPNLQRRVTVGSGGSSSGILGNAAGNIGGAETHTLTIAEMPAHTHTYIASNLGADVQTAGPRPATQGGFPTGSTGGSGAHNNIQPSAVVNKLIKYA